MTYFAKQIIGALATPLAIAIVLAALGAALLWRKRMAAGRVSVICACAVAYLGALCPVGNALLNPLERRYAALDEGLSTPAVLYIVVLGSGYAPRDGVPVTAALDEEGLARVVEGVRLMQRFRSAQLVLSGGARDARNAPAIGYAKLARSLGVAEASMVVLSDPLDTRAEAHAVSAALGDAPFLLVTSAAHMPRAMEHMLAAGARPVAAPTAQRVRADCGLRAWIPGASGLRKTELALHEYLGLLALAAGVS